MAAPVDADKQQSTEAGGPSKKVSVLRAEIAIAVVSVVLGTSVWVLVESKLAPLSQRFEPREERLRLTHQVPWTQDSLTMTEAELKATEDQLIQSRLEYYKRRAALEAYDAVPRPPAAKAAEQTGASKGEDKPAAPQTREELAQGFQAAGRATDILIERVELLENRANELRADAEERRRRAAVEFGEGHFAYRAGRLLASLVAALLALTLAYAALRWPLKRYEERARASGYEPNTRLVSKVVGGLILVLVAYLTFQVAGAAFVGLLVLLYFLYRMPWPEKRAASQK